MTTCVDCGLEPDHGTVYVVSQALVGRVRVSWTACAKCWAKYERMCWAKYERMCRERSTKEHAA